MHVAFISHEYPLWASGGIGSFLQTFGRALTKEGHKVTIIGAGTSSKEGCIDDKGVSLYRLPVSQNFIPGFIFNSIQLNKKLIEINKQHPIDVIEASELGLALLFVLSKVPKVIRLHGGHHFFSEAEKRGINWRKGLLEKRSFKKADGFIAVSRYVKEHTGKYLSYHNSPVHIIPHPVKIPSVFSKTENTSKSILFAGTICEKKGVRELLQAFQVVKERYPDYQLDLYGRDWFYPDGSSYIKKIQQEYPKNFFENITFHGAVTREKLYKQYNNAAFCVFPSHMETQGLVTLEAMSLGKAVVFSKYGPGPETISHKDNGLLCDVYDPKDIASKICWYIENPEEVKAIGQRALKTVKEKYDIALILKKNIEFYHSLLDS
ncbi:glycosyltransferase family 4 protein [Patiriisocius hiemis]|uniref:Glycosyltransferase family 4 protein n=1 Tax=Patiriisocius hiemis TaxID=3075604 RepID=A0ABU2YD22_9FLAO|nr:glycosyltransferase family 4 protein [Constantimarinum sp. W242]MDT0556053.1 glycosyltransferase family 4 protein [Constantimarinum sp. W242]